MKIEPKNLMLAGYDDSGYVFYYDNDRTRYARAKAPEWLKRIIDTERKAAYQRGRSEARYEVMKALGL